jgi:hypothetical protein
VSLLPDGQKIISRSDDKTLRVWNLNQSSCECVLEGAAISQFLQQLIPGVFLDGHELSLGRFIDLPFCQVFAIHSRLVIGHKISEKIPIPPSRSSTRIVPPIQPNKRSECLVC